jgi:hypothetical protein
MAIVTHVSINEDSVNVNIDVKATNNDAGAIYNSADLNVTKLLAYNPTPEIDSLWELPANQANYSSIADMVAAWPGVSIRSSPSSEVYTGWNAVTNSDGSFSLSKSGAAADLWLSTDINSNQDMQAYTINIPKSQLSLVGLGNYTANDYGTITLSQTTVPDAFIGYEGGAGGLSWQANGNHYQVAVPEASITGLLIGATALAIAATRKGRSLGSLWR